MQATETDEVREVLKRISGWPAEQRLALARDILQTLAGALPAKASSRKSLKDLLGALPVAGSPPTDEACATWLEEERLRKHGR